MSKRFCKKCGQPAIKRGALLCQTHERERIRDWARKRRKEKPNHAKEYRVANRERFSEREKTIRRANLQRTLLLGAKQRARKFGLNFALVVDDIHIPTRCPLLGIPLIVGDGKQGPNSPTLDRIFNERGYVAGNVVVISHAANTCKGGLRADDIIRIGTNLKFLELFRAAP